MKKKIDYYKKINIVQLVNELNQKTNLVVKLSEKLKKYTDEEVVTETDLSNDILKSIQNLINNDSITVNDVNFYQMKKDYEEEEDRKTEIMRNNNNDSNKNKDIDNSSDEKETKNQKSLPKKPVKHESAKAKIHKALYGGQKQKYSKMFMSYRNNPLSIEDEKLQRDIEKYPFILFLYLLYIYIYVIIFF